jgi:tRNA 2-thiouridine synthesizing protein B
MSVLHIVNKSPFDRNSLDTCLRLARKGSAILLIEDGVYALRKNTDIAVHLLQVMDDLAVYALQPDMQARGLLADATIDGVELVDYDGFVRLATEYDKLQSWL